MLNNPHQSSEHIVFIDTSAIAAVMNRTDQYHKEAVRIYKEIIVNDYSAVLTNFIIAETHALILNTTHNISLGLEWLMEAAYKDFTVVRPSKNEELEAVNLLAMYKDKQWSLVDAISFTIMEKLSIPYYFSFDEDFRQTGKFLDITSYI